MANTFDWVEIHVTDTERAAGFYERLFGWSVVEKETADGSDCWIFDTGGTPRIETLSRGGLWRRPVAQQRGVVVYVLVEDIGATLQQASALGGQVVLPRTPQGSGFRACFSDLDGNVFGLWQENSVA
jgi:predicted enzyme related to lactoylglutathione lyase